MDKEKKEKRSVPTTNTLDLLYNEISEELRPLPEEVEQVPTLHQDIFSMLYIPNYNITNGAYAGILRKIQNTDSFRDLKKITNFDDILSYTSAVRILKELPSQKKNKKPEGEPKNQERDQDNNNSKNDMLLQETINAAIGKTKKETQNDKNILSSLGIGSNKGKLHTLDIQDKVDIIKDLLGKSSDIFMKVMDLANRMLARAKNDMAKDPEYIPASVSKVIMSDDVAHIADPSILLDDDQFYAAIADRKLVTYEIKERWDKKRGPIIVMIDTSGSMDTNRQIWSKAIALVLYNIAREHKRRFRAVLFSSAADIESIDISTDRVELNKVRKMVNLFFSGGTSFDAPYQEAIEAIDQEEEFHNATMFLITDGESDDLTSSTREWIDDFLKEGNKNIVITVDAEQMYIDNIRRSLPVSFYMNIKSSEDNSAKIADIIKGEMYVRGNIFRRYNQKS